MSPSPKQRLLGWLLRTRGSSVPEGMSLRDNFRVLTQPELRLLLFWKPRYNGGDGSSNCWPVLCTCYARDLPSSPHQPRAERTVNIPTLRTRRLRQGTPLGWHGSRPPPGPARVGPGLATTGLGRFAQETRTGPSVTTAQPPRLAAQAPPGKSLEGGWLA